MADVLTLMTAVCWDGAVSLTSRSLEVNRNWRSGAWDNMQLLGEVCEGKDRYQ